MSDRVRLFYLGRCFLRSQEVDFERTKASDAVAVAVKVTILADDRGCERSIRSTSTYGARARWGDVLRRMILVHRVSVVSKSELT